MDEYEFKQRFIAEYHKTPRSALQAAERAYGAICPEATQLAIKYKDDPEILAAIDRLNERENRVPGKAEILKRLLSLADDYRTDTKEKINALKLYAEISGLVDKTQKIENTTTNKVMLVKDHDDWASKAAEQQRKLTGRS